MKEENVMPDNGLLLMWTREVWRFRVEGIVQSILGFGDNIAVMRVLFLDIKLFHDVSDQCC